MVVDHPFFYAIQDGKTGDLLFIGVDESELTRGASGCSAS
jgi:serine protease inhibitor